MTVAVYSMKCWEISTGDTLFQKGFMFERLGTIKYLRLTKNLKRWSQNMDQSVLLTFEQTCARTEILEKERKLLVFRHVHLAQTRQGVSSMLTGARCSHFEACSHATGGMFPIDCNELTLTWTDIPKNYRYIFYSRSKGKTQSSSMRTMGYRWLYFKAHQARIKIKLKISITSWKSLLILEAVGLSEEKKNHDAR